MKRSPRRRPGIDSSKRRSDVHPRRDCWVAALLAITCACQPSGARKEDQARVEAAAPSAMTAASSAVTDASSPPAESSSSGTRDSDIVATPIVLEEGLLAIRTWEHRLYWIAAAGETTRLGVIDAGDAGASGPRSFVVDVTNSRTFAIAPSGLVWLTRDALLTSDLDGRQVRVLARDLVVDEHWALAVDGERIYYTNGVHIRRATFGIGNGVTLGSAWGDPGMFGESSPTAIAILAGGVYWLVNDQLMRLRASRPVPFVPSSGSNLRCLAGSGDSLVYTDSGGIHRLRIAGRRDTLLAPHRASAVAAKRNAVYFASTGRRVNQLFKSSLTSLESTAIASFEGEATDIAVGDTDVYWIVPASGRVYRAKE